MIRKKFNEITTLQSKAKISKIIKYHFQLMQNAELSEPLEEINLESDLDINCLICMN
jgi:hypothetical protein